ncbi:PIG-L family deacetylase [Oscillatoria laete-virens NRMC-F 0139]|nr:PIG-L family deacetylase [Oscillatoria laete-virens]MDL5053169.1 PIG-L family deacetylase [Oscillatoria laete-virens NRMC-F 0139]
MNMTFHKPTAEILIPDGRPEPVAFARTTHMGIGAHQDDLEFMCFHGIKECFHREDQWFTGVTVTDGSGSSRSDRYANCSNDQMRAIRKEEQRRAAIIGEYSAIVQLDYPSGEIKGCLNPELVADLGKLLTACAPQIVYTHNLADKHDTHLGVVIPVITALRKLPRAARPEKLYGCEVWRNIDWLDDQEKVRLNVSGFDHLMNAMMGVFDSQIAGGKRYDLATLGRKRANATYLESHNIDTASEVEFAMDLTPLITDDTLDIVSFISGKIENFKQTVMERVRRQL